jgi:hypothetical protein
MNELLTPVTQLDAGFSSAQYSFLHGKGIGTLGQFCEALKKNSLVMFQAGFSSSLRDTLRHKYDSLVHALNFGNCIEFMPPLGFILDPKDSPELMKHRAETQGERLKLANVAKKLEEKLPREFMLTDMMRKVPNQLSLGSCTGFGSTSAREFLEAISLSPGFGYRGAKMLDGMPHVEGSYQEYCYRFFVKYGQLPEHEFDYEKCLCNEDIKPYFRRAKRFKIKGYVDLIVEPKHLSLVLKAALCGMLTPDISPRPVSISLAVYDSFVGESARQFGLISVPFEGEALQGGHAMAVAGYTELYGTSYFVVQNSWGEAWAKDNPLGLPGYALIPEGFINQPGLVGELLMTI